MFIKNKNKTIYESIPKVLRSIVSGEAHRPTLSFPPLPPPPIRYPPKPPPKWFRTPLKLLHHPFIINFQLHLALHTLELAYSTL